MFHPIRSIKSYLLARSIRKAGKIIENADRWMIINHHPRHERRKFWRAFNSSRDMRKEVSRRMIKYGTK